MKVTITRNEDDTYHILQEPATDELFETVVAELNEALEFAKACFEDACGR